jgi:hypothetical protein
VSIGQSVGDCTPLAVVGSETFGEPPQEWLTLKVTNESDTPIRQCYGRIVAFGPLHRGYPTFRETPKTGDRLVWLVSTGDLRHYDDLAPESSQSLVVGYRQDSGPAGTLSIPTGPDAFCDLGRTEGYQIVIELAEDTLQQLSTMSSFARMAKTCDSRSRRRRALFALDHVLSR